MQDHGSRNNRVYLENRDQAGQNIQNGVTINRVSPPAHPGRKKKLAEKKVGKRIALGIISLLVLLAIGTALLWNYLFSGLDTQKPSGTGYPTEALTNQPPESKDITNILLLGLDTRDPKTERGLSDSIIILTVDRKNNVIKMTSIMRDCYVYIPGYKAPTKINEAHNLGGPELAMRTVNNTFRLNIQKYMVVNFQSMADIIDIAGGVTLTITEKERVSLNDLLHFDFPSLGSTINVVTAGTQKVNGKQAVDFARIRHIDSDAERTRRQRDVLSALFLGFKEASAVNKAQMIQKGLSEITTNMTATEITSLGLDVLPKMSNEIKQLRLPIDGYYTVISNSVWYMNVDYNRMIPKVYEFIYGASQPFDPVPTIPKEIITPNTSSKSSSASSSQKPTPTDSLVSSSSSSSISGETPTVAPTVTPTATPTLIPTPTTSAPDSTSTST